MNFQGIGAVAAGINQGIDQRQRDDLLAEQRADRERNQQFQDEQRAQWRLQNQRANDAADRAETLRKKNAAIQPVGSDVTKTVDLRDAVMPGAKQITVDDDGNPSAAALPALQTTTRKFTDADAARALANNLQESGDVAGALSARQTADKLSMAEARAAFARLDASSAGMPLQDYVNALADIGRRDESPIDFRPTKINDDGTVGVTVFNRHTGYEMPLTIKDAAHAREVAMSHFNPEGYEAWKLEQAKSALRRQEKKEGRERFKSVPGGFIDEDSGKFTRTMFGSGEVVGHTADGEPIYGSGKGGAGKGGGKGDGKDPTDPDVLAGFDPKKAQEQATAFVDKTLDPEGKLTPQQRAKEIHSRYYALRQAHSEQMRTDTFVDQAERILRNAASNPKTYADQYAKALAAAGPDVMAELARRGIRPPAAPLLTQPGGLARPAR